MKGYKGWRNFLELRTGEVRRKRIPRTSVNKGKKEGLTEREAKHVRLFEAEKPWSRLVRGACLVRPLTPVISPRRTRKHPLGEKWRWGMM